MYWLRVCGGSGSGSPARFRTFAHPARKHRSTDRLSLYSLRHTFKDRLRAAKCPGEIMDRLMGHGSKKPDYGEGYPLSVLAEWVERVAFDAPEWLR